jgi:hypothetical protein
MYRAAGRKIFPSEVTGFDSAFLNRDFVRKNQAESKSNFGEWCPGAELNHRHLHFQCSALPTELPGL